MTKNDLIKYNEYTDTSKLVDEISDLLKEYNHRYSEHGICTMLDTFFQNKKSLLDMFKKSPHYVGDMRIRVPKELKRFDSARDVSDFCEGFYTRVEASSVIESKVDENGKSVLDYLKTGKRMIKAADIESLNLNHEERTQHLNQFNTHGVYAKSAERASEFCRIIHYFGYNHQVVLQNAVSDRINYINPDLKMRNGQKTSRAFNKVCETYGVHKAELYNKLYAQYSDMVSGLTRKVDYMISLNPYDYLTMSFGVNWASCHSIDQTNKRNMPGNYHGQYCAGTMSYMLDKTSIITYVLDRDGDVHDGKIYRNMFHFKDGCLVQNRVYPQGNDGNTDLYTVFREFMWEEIAAMLGVDNQWEITGNNRHIADVVITQGSHYTDYTHNSQCNLSRIKGSVTTRDLIIGATPICTKCGTTITSRSSLAHSYC